MTITFNCPKCDNLIAFDSRHIGKRAKCQSCGQILIIPAKDDQTPQVIEPETEKAEPLPGFYRAVFVESWRLFIDRENVTTLAFVVVAVCFKFFLARAICCCNYITYFLAWGWLFGFYLNIIHETAFGNDKLPEIYLGTTFTFFWQVLRPFLIFFFTLFVVQLPFIITLALLKDKDFTYTNIWRPEIGLHSILQVLFILGLFLFPMAILNVAVGQDVALLRPDYLIKPLRRAFVPYLIPVALLVAFGLLETQTAQYQTGLPPLTITARLAVNLLLQIIAILAMRSIALFYRHHSCHFTW
ncbi:MAG TPA: hypothetical protein VMX13_02075 [Sedimentisphaerales bacterium]|nr:hypothetical protein [Sedimentisphaerales bacterium]